MNEEDYPRSVLPFFLSWTGITVCERELARERERERERKEMRESHSSHGSNSTRSTPPGRVMGTGLA